MQRSRIGVLGERGVALAVAIFALVVVGALVAGAFFVGMQEQRVGRNTIKLEQAFSSAEQGAQLAVANWNAQGYNQLAFGDSVTFGGTISGRRGWYRGSIRRMNRLLYLVRSEGFGPDSATRQQVGLLVRLRPVEVDIAAALETQGATKIGGSSQIDGNDNPPGGWSCPPNQPALPGIRITDSTQITTSGCGGLSCVDGSVKVEEDPNINDSTLTTFGDATFDDLKSMATKIVPGGNYQIDWAASGGQCNTALVTNWGDPDNPTGVCGSYFPIIWVDGDISINGDVGQGVLVVDGNLNVQGGFNFYGPVIVRGALSTQGTGGHFNGGVVAANINLDQNSVLGDAVINYSSCALVKALNSSAPGSLMQERSWVTLY